MWAALVPIAIRQVAMLPIWLCNFYRNDGIGDDGADVRIGVIRVCDWDVEGGGGDVVDYDDGDGGDVIDCVCHFDLIRLLEVIVYCWLYIRRLIF